MSDDYDQWLEVKRAKETRNAAEVASIRSIIEAFWASNPDLQSEPQPKSEKYGEW